MIHKILYLAGMVAWGGLAVVGAITGMEDWMLYFLAFLGNDILFTLHDKKD